MRKLLIALLLVFVLATVMAVPAYAQDTERTPEEQEEYGERLSYDINGNGRIDLAEVIDAFGDFLIGRISVGKFIQVLIEYQISEAVAQVVGRYSGFSLE